MPPIMDVGVNPFWSERVADEARLQRQRPQELPPVPDDGSVNSRSTSARRGAGAKEGKGVGASGTVRRTPHRDGRDRSRSDGRKEGRGLVPSGSAQSNRFRTPPSSWTKSVEEKPVADVQATVERELERQMFEHFKDENMRLRLELEELKKSRSSGGPSVASWSAVEAEAVEPGCKTPPPPPRREEKVVEKDLRWTPNGTQVPTGPPPTDQAPVDFSTYDAEEMNRALRWLGPEPTRILQPEVHGGGIQSRHGGPQGGSFSRHGQGEGGIQSRQDEMRLKRPTWLDDEASRLEALLHDRFGGNGFQDAYWATPVSGNGLEVQPLSRAHGELCQQPLSRAHGELCQQPLGRAHGELPHPPLSRATQRGDQGDGSEQVGGDLGWTSYQEDRRGHHQHHSGVAGDLQKEVRGESTTVPTKEQEMRRIFQEEIISLRKRLEENEKKERSKNEDDEKTKEHKDGLEGSLKSIPVVLPKLSEPGGRNSSLEAGDWLAQVRPYIADVGQGAEKWWDITRQSVMDRYAAWLEANPLERVHIKAPELDNTMPGSDRLNQRVTTLLLSAVPESLKSELITTRQLSVPGVLFAILKRFQPGGLAEKTYTLSELTATTQAVSPTQAVQKLRHWKRQQTRALELGLTLPDPLIMVKALDVVMKDLWALYPQASFRLPAFRMQHQIDVRPTMTSLGLFYDLLLAEADQMVYGKTTENPEEDQPAAVKALQQQPNKVPSSPQTPQRICSFWGTEKGCRLGRACRYLHDWTGIEDRSSRCWICSSTSHQRGDCPAARSAGGSGGAGDGKGTEEKGAGKSKKGKGKDGGKSDSKGQKGGGKPAVNKTATSSSPGTATSSSPQQGKDGQAQSEKKDEEGAGSGPGSTQETAGLVAEVTSLLKSMRVAQGSKPSISAVRLRKMEKGKESTVLLDGGATNCLRRASSWKEHEEAHPVQVSLASGTVLMRQHQRTGTLLVMDEVQPIVPISDLVKIGVEVEWTSNGCTMRKAGRVLPVFLDGGCPVIGKKEGMQLLGEIEEFYERRSRLRIAAIRADPRGHDQEQIEAANFAVDYPEVPPRIVERVPGRVDWDVNLVPLNRRMRKRLQRAKTVIIHLFSGTETQVWDMHGEEDMVFLNIEIKKGMDLHNDHLFGFLEQLCQTGKVRGLFAGPPCRTVSLLRFRQEEGGPRPLRSRYGEESRKKQMEMLFYG